MATLNIQVINASANNPSSRGKAERAVQTVKTLFRKMLATASSNSLNWEMLPFLASKILNHTVTPRTGFKPAEMIFGRHNMAESFLDREPILPVHHSVKNNAEQIKNLAEELTEMSNIARENLIKIRQLKHEEVNKNRITKLFKPGNIVFTLDRYQLAGNNRVLKTKFHPSPFVVLNPYFTTCLIRRIADGFTALYSVDDIKLYRGIDKTVDPIFSTLPPEITKVLLHEFRELTDSDYETIIKFDPLNIPNGIPLVDTIDPKPPDNRQIFRPISQHVKDEFLPEENEQNDVTPAVKVAKTPAADNQPADQDDEDPLAGRIEPPADARDAPQRTEQPADRQLLEKQRSELFQPLEVIDELVEDEFE